MIGRCLRYVMAVMLCVAFLPSAEGKSSASSPRSFLRASFSSASIYEGEKVVYEVTLFSSTPEIAGVEVVRNPEYDNLAVARAAADRRLSEVDVNGKTFYSVVIDRFFVDPRECGKYQLKGGAYRIGFNVPVLVEDPFFGKGYVMHTEVESLTAPDATLKVRKLPEKGKPEDFSGAVGNFKIEVTLPAGEIGIGNEAYAIVTISGEGDLSGAALPDVRRAFGQGLQFKAMTDNRNDFMTHGVPGSEIEMECIFVPTEEGEMIIGGIPFSFFNPSSGKYETSMSEEVRFSVGSGKAEKEEPPVYYEI